MFVTKDNNLESTLVVFSVVDGASAVVDGASAVVDGAIASPPTSDDEAALDCSDISMGQASSEFFANGHNSVAA